MEENKELKKEIGEIIEVPISELDAVDVSSKYIEKSARAFIMGSNCIGRRKEVREALEEKVIKRIGRKGKFLIDKLFELIEGVYVVDKRAGATGRDIRYYMVPPNLAAITYALDRVLGKPVTKSESREEKKGIMIVEHIIRNLAGEKDPSLEEEDEDKRNNSSGIEGGMLDIRTSEVPVSR